MDLPRVLQYLRPGAGFAIENGQVIAWHSPDPQPTLAEREAAWVTLQQQDATAATAATTANTNRLTLEQQAAQALADNKAFYQRVSSTAAQQLAQQKALSRQVNGIIRLLLKRLEATD